MITTRWIMGNEDLSDAYAVRKDVFVCEQGIEEANEYDDMDAQSLHLVIYVDGEPSATGRMYFKNAYHFGRIAVLKKYRGKGLGDMLMRMMLFRVVDWDGSLVEISAQTQAQGFYEHYGFEAEGDIYMEEGIPHVKMTVTPDKMRLESKCSRCGKCGKEQK